MRWWWWWWIPITLINYHHKKSDLLKTLIVESFKLFASTQSPIKKKSCKLVLPLPPGTALAVEQSCHGNLPINIFIYSQTPTTNQTFFCLWIPLVLVLADFHLEAVKYRIRADIGEQQLLEFRLDGGLTDLDARDVRDLKMMFRVERWAT